MKRLYLKRGKEESLGRFHPWLFSGAIERAEGDVEEGDIVDVVTKNGDFVARGHCAVGSIALRVLTFKDEIIDQNWWDEKVASAYKLRVSLRLVDNPVTTCYRLIHGEGDMLPGLIVDIYGDVAVIQCHSVGMFVAREQITKAVNRVYGSKIKAVYDKSSGSLPRNAGVESADGYLYGGSKGENVVVEGGNKFIVNWEKGQKTGFFIDQRHNRELVGHYSKGRKVLNTFCYTGGFSVYALQGGASEVISVDSSERAVDLANKNVELNFGVDAPHKGIVDDVFDYMKGDGSEYDMIILDPPAFAKHHKVLGNATQGYKRLNIKAMEQISKGGILFTFSCSQAMSKELFRTTIFSAAATVGRKARILHQLTQPADHPINIYHPEGEYLKGLVLEIE